MAKSTTHADAQLNVMRGSNYTAFTPYVGLLDGGTELTDTGYARQSITFGAPATVGGRRRIVNTNEPAFANSSGGAWAEADQWAIYDASSAGNVIYGPNTLKDNGGSATPRTLSDGDTLTFEAGNLYVEEY